MKKLMIIVATLTLGANSLQADNGFDTLKQLVISGASVTAETLREIGGFIRPVIDGETLVTTAQAALSTEAVAQAAAPTISAAVEELKEESVSAAKDLANTVVPATREFVKEATPVFAKIGNALTSAVSVFATKVGNATLSAGKSVGNATAAAGIYVGNKIAAASTYAGNQVVSGAAYTADKAVTATCNGTQYVGSCIEAHPKRALAVAGVVTVLAYAKYQAIQEKNKALAELATAPHDINNRWSREDRDRRIKQIQGRYEAVMEGKFVSAVQTIGNFVIGALAATGRTAYNACANLVN